MLHLCGAPPPPASSVPCSRWAVAPRRRRRTTWLPRRCRPRKRCPTAFAWKPSAAWRNRPARAGYRR
ncbi:MAG: hypothetical protein EOO24_46275, partial [Comamonadaceae bacterium]